MSKATSLNSISQMDPNVSHEIDNVLAEIESSKHNLQPQQQQQLPQMIPQQVQQMPPMQGQQLPPQQYIQSQNPNFAMPNYYQNQSQQSSGGIMDFLASFMIGDNELKWVVIIAGLFVLMNLNQTVNLFGKYMSFTVNELGNSTIVGNVARGLTLSLVFVLINKFM